MREAVDQPRGRQPRHPRADHRDALAEKEELEVAVPQRSPGVRHGTVGELVHDSPKRLISAVRAGSFFCSVASSFAMDCASQVCFAMRASLRTRAPFVVSAIFIWRPSVGCGLRSTIPISSRAATVAPMD